MSPDQYPADSKPSSATTTTTSTTEMDSSRPKTPPSPSLRSKETSEPAKEPTTQTEKQIAAQKQAEEDAKYPHGLKLALILGALCLAVFLVALDQTIISTAIPKITDQFRSVQDIGWYGSSYLLTTTALQPSFGKIYSIFNIKYTFITAIVIFEIGSLVCATAPTSTALIIGRAVAGLGVGGLFSGAINILAFCLPLRKRPIAFGLIGGMWGIASVAGPLLGGVFTDHVSWRWCKYLSAEVTTGANMERFLHKSPNWSTFDCANLLPPRNQSCQQS